MAEIDTTGIFDCPAHPDAEFCNCEAASTVSLDTLMGTKYKFVQNWESLLVGDNVCVHCEDAQDFRSLTDVTREQFAGDF